MAYDGIQFTNRVDATSERKLNAKVVDNILNSRTYGVRLLGNGKPMMGKTFDYSVKITDSGAGEFFTGLETLNSAASDTLITLSYAQTAFQQPDVSIMLDAFANSGATGTIDLQVFKMEEAISEAVSRIGSAIYSTGSSNQPLGLGAIVDDATDVTTIGGQSRSTYTTLKATRTAATTLTLATLATLEDTISAAGVESEEPNINLTTKTVWSLYEQLLQPSVRADYAAIGYNAIQLRGNDVLKSRAELKGAAGFTALSYRGKPVIKDDACTSGNWFMLNERYFEWRGRTVTPNDYNLEKVNLSSERSVIDGVSDSFTAPSSAGWFYQPKQMLPNQAGMIGRYYLIGQVTASQFRRQGRLTGVTSV